MTAATAPFLASLKAATRADHERIGANPYAAAIFAGTLSAAGYRAWLERFYGFYAPAEARLAAFPGLARYGLELEARYKLPLLERDLHFLGCENVAALPQANTLPPLRTPAQALGCLYVFEGSTLGGQLILRQLREQLGFDAAGTSFFASYGDQVGPMWKAFCAGMQRYVDAYGAEDEIIASVRAVYAAMDAWLRG